MPFKHYNAFISYSHNDGEVFAKELAERISNDPKGTGMSFWKDYDNMHYGQWSRQIEKAIDAVEFLVMVLTPGALASPNCKDEWMYARKKGVCILPVNALPGDTNFYKTFPKWLEKQHIYNLDKHWQPFINDLNSRPDIEPIPFMAPRLTTVPCYVPRYEELSQLKKFVLSGSQKNTIGITTSLQGSGGFGKTTLAIALCNDDEIINHFDDGILWVTLGQQSGSSRDALHKLYRGISREEASFIDIEEAQQKLVEKMEKRNCLIVIDDVWKPEDLKQVTASLANSTVLITSRFAHILPQQQTMLIKVDEMNSSESIALLTGKFIHLVKNKKAFEKLARQLGHWPLLLKLAGAEISEYVSEEETPEKALAFVQKKYDRKGITGFDPEDATQRNHSVKNCLEASIELLKNSEKDKLLQLGIFPDDENIPYDIISLLWHIDDFDTEEILTKLHRYGLLDLDFVNKTCSVHDVLLHYYNEQLEKTMVSVLHENLIQSLGDFKTFKNKYSWKWFIWHLMRARRTETVTYLLQNMDWIEAKLDNTNIIELLNDYEHFLLDDDTALIYKALKLSAHVLGEDKNQLPSQLIGRLGYFKNEPVVGLLKKANMTKKISWLKPVIPALTPPGNLSRILKGHTGGINSLLIHEGHIISGAEDSRIRIWEIESGQCLQTFHGHISGISLLKVHEGKIISGSYDSTIRIWDITTGKCLQILDGHTGGINALLVHDDKIISASSDSSIRIWEIKSGLCLRILEGHSGTINFLAVHDNNIISGAVDSTIRIWEIASGLCLQIIKQHMDWITSLVIHENKIISASVDSTIRIWEINTGLCLHTLWGHSDSISCLWVQEGKIISGSYDTTIRIWDLESGKCSHKLIGHTDVISSMLIHDGKIITGSGDTTVCIWEIESGRRIHTLQGHTDLVGSLLVNGAKIISGSYDSTIRIWEIDPEYRLETGQGHTGAIRSLLYDQGRIISGSLDSTIRIWETETGHCLHLLKGHKSWISTLLIHAGEIISGSDDRTVRIWKTETGQCLHILEGHSGRITSLIVSNNKIISGSGDKTIRIWDPASGRLLQLLTGHKGMITSLLVHDNKIISGSKDSNIRIWDIESGHCLQTLEGHRGWITSLSFHGNKIVSGSYDDTIRIWEIESGKCLRTLQEHTGRISLLLVQNGKIISGAFDGSIRIWDIESGHCLQTLSGHRGRIRSLLVEDDKMISGSDDTTICVWNMESGKCIQILKEHADEIRSLFIKDNKLISTDSSGLLIIYDAKTFMHISKYYSDAEHTSQPVYDNNKIFSGDQLGQLHILEMIGI